MLEIISAFSFGDSADDLREIAAKIGSGKSSLSPFEAEQLSRVLIEAAEELVALGEDIEAQQKAIIALQEEVEQLKEEMRNAADKKP